MNILEITDRTGRNIHLSDERWVHINKHPKISSRMELIKETLEKPDKITESYDEDGVWFYYKYDKQEKEYVFVSVKYLNGYGFIITSFYTNKIQ